MKRTIKHVGLTFGSAALIALGVSCQRESRPAQAPEGGAPSTVEPGPGAARPAPLGPEMGTIEAPSGRQGTPAQPGPTGQYGDQTGAEGRQRGAQPGAEQPGGMGAGMGGAAQPGQREEQPQAAGAPSERALCDALSGVAKLHVEDVQHGVVIVAVPRTGTHLSTLRDDARRIEGAIHQGPSAGGAAESCGLVSVGRLPGVTTTITEGANSVRIVMTTSSLSDVKELRRHARDQVSALIKAPPTEKR
jgi:hypothetical protein